MTTIDRFDNLKQIVMASEVSFNELAAIHGAVHFKKELAFALEALKNNSFLAEMAFQNQDAFKRAIINVAAIGLTLNPVHKLAYLVPRDKKVMLDVSYRGYVQLAVDVGSIKWCKAEIVRAFDTFIYEGMGKEPTHRFMPFGERGEIVGIYCIAKTHDNEYLTEMMAVSEVHSIRERSMSWKAYQKDAAKLNPWVTDETEMFKKTVIKRAYKSWPMTNTRERFEKAIDVTNETDPIELTPKQNHSPELVGNVRHLLESLNRPEEAFVQHAVRIFKRDIKKLEDLTPQEMNQSVSMLNSFVEKKQIGGENEKP